MAQAKRRGWRQGENEWTILGVFRLSFRWSPSLLAARCPSPFRRPSGAGRETIQYLYSTGMLYARGTPPSVRYSYKLYYKYNESEIDW